MEVAIKKSLQIRSTLYKSIDASSLSQLSTIAEVNGLDAKALSAAFDKFMTVHRQDSSSVSTSDIEMFRNQYTKTATNNGKSLAAARGSNLFHKGSWEDIDVATAAKDINMIAADLTTINAPNNNNNTSSQRITPYMNKRPKRPSAATPHQPTPPSSGKFKQRAQPGKVVSILNPHIFTTITANGDAAAAEDNDVDTISPTDSNNITDKSSVLGCSIQVMTTAAAALDSTTTGIPKYMNNKLEDRAAYIERRIIALEDDVEAGALKHFFTATTDNQQQQGEDTDSSMTTPHPVAVSSQNTSIFIGRICCDAEEGRLNAQSLLLEGSMRTSRGERVRLDVNKCTSGYRLFPGQVVAVIGTNPSGYCVIADKVVPGLPLPNAKTPLADLAALYTTYNASATMTMMIAAGPYTASDDLSYEPLEALLSKAAEERPDTLVLCGPFVDADHILLRDGSMVDITFEDLYLTRVVGSLERFAAGPGCTKTKIVMVPSVRDLHMHPVFPQPRQQLMGAAVGGESMNDGDGGGVVMHMTNPVTLKCNEIVVGACSADWLLAASSSETSMQPAAGQQQQQQQQDRLGDLSAMLLSQRSYFPMYPAPLNIPLDAARGGAGGLDLPCSPDVLVSPSDLAPFAKLVSPSSSSSESSGGVETVVINPGRLTRGVTGGTYAKVVIAPLKEGVEVAGGAAASTNAPVAHGINQRCKVEIVKI
jgi:DNA polymerase alpha subunit B